MLLWKLRRPYTILIATHNMAQPQRASEECIFMLISRVVEHALTEEMFAPPTHKEPLTTLRGATAEIVGSGHSRWAGRAGRCKSQCRKILQSLLLSADSWGCNAHLSAC